MDVSKFDKSNAVKLEHPANMLFISVTFDVLKLDKSILVNELQSQNTPFILVTLAVLKLSPKVILVKDVSFLNISFILVIPEVSILDRSIDVTLVRLLNNPDVDDGLAYILLLLPIVIS